MQRLDKYLSDAGAASRKELKQMIKSGRVCVNGQVIKSPEYKVNEEKDSVTLDGEPVCGGCIVIMLNKPAGYVTSTDDPRDPTVMELLPPEYRKLCPVGRLDKETEGLLLFTNDGDLLHRLISPKHGVVKTYYAEHEGTAGEEDVKAFREGCLLRDGTKCLSAVLEPQEEGKSIIRVQEGKYHQVRRMMASRGMHVTYLKRVAEGMVSLDSLEIGKTRKLTDGEVASLLTGTFDE